ncbi:serine/threonine-protein kinase PEPKR2 [Impatiens glandulifera]|uniref:serine/threonine-protein kinase PEPKR2 n=1 Tax=Impatiens glandulifera TaxID=253017 RepID=UPI001FB1753D|nr:serine/threonine-protein kinase PEPKR2 [Impatiens glandulifera]
MRKKRKGTEVLRSNKGDQTVESSLDTRSSFSNLKSHYSLEDYARLRKKCKEDVVGNDEPDESCNKNRLMRTAATAPPCGTTSSVSAGRGLKRKIGCIDAATQMGRKNKILEDYIRGDNIGKGKFGSVWLCRRKFNGLEFACKTLKKGEETVHREVEIMQHLSGHPGVVMLEAVYEDDECFHLVMELCPCGRLIDQMTEEGKYTEQRAANLFKELMLVMRYCHEMGVVHRDIKPENILLTAGGKIKLADFGLAMRVSNGQKLTGLAGSPAYVAPEVLSGNYSEKADIWSAGVLLHALLTGALPFQGNSLEAVFEAIKNTNLDFHTGIWESVSKPARNLMERILTRDVDKRITVDEVLNHPWILFYTERTLKTLSARSKAKVQSSSPSPSQPLTNTCLDALCSSLPLSGSSGGRGAEEQDENGLVDALSVAISHVRISEPKKVRLCGPTSPIREQCSSNLNPNSLCKAF